MTRIGLDSRLPNYETLSPAPQAQVVLAFDKESIDNFFDSGLGVNSDSLKVFSKGDGRLLNFTHELGAQEGGKAKNEFTLKIVDHDNYFLNSLFDRKFDQVLNQARKIVGLDAKETEISTNAKSETFDYRDELQTISGGLPKFYIAYGLGSNTNHWAGPFVCHLLNGIYQEDGEGIQTLELKFYPEFRTDIVPKQIEGKGGQVGLDVKSTINVAQFFFNTAGSKGSTDRKIETIEVRWLINNLQNALEESILKYLRGCGYKNVLLLFSDLEKIMEDANYDTFSGTKKITWGKKTKKYLRILNSSNLDGVAGKFADQEALYDLHRIFKLLGIDVTLPEISSENTSKINWIQNPHITQKVTTEQPYEYDDEMTKYKDDVTYGLTIKAPPQGQSVFKPVLDILNNLQDHVQRLVTPFIGVEANALIVDEWRRAHPNYITDPDEPVIVIGEEALIQKILYHKENSSLKISDYIYPSKDCIVSYISNEANDYREFMKNFHVSKRGKGFFDYNSGALPDEFSWNDRAAAEGYAVPVFKINTQNPNVLRFTSKSKGMFFSTLAGTCQTIASVIKESLKEGGVNPYMSVKSNLSDTIARVLETRNKEGDTNNVRKFAKAPTIDFKKIGDEVADLVLEGDPLGPSPVSTGNDIVSFLTYINNFYKMFNFQHMCSIKTLPYYNLSELSVLNERAILLKNQVTPVLEERSTTNSIYTGIWAFRAFKHVISTSDAYSEFSMYKMAFEFENNGDKGTIGEGD